MKKPDKSAAVAAPKPAIVARMPVKLVRQLDKACKAARRSRSAEIVCRLQESFSASIAPTSAPSVAAACGAQTAPAEAAQQVKKLREVTHAR